MTTDDLERRLAEWATRALLRACLDNPEMGQFALKDSAVNCAMRGDGDTAPHRVNVAVVVTAYPIALAAKESQP